MAKKARGGDDGVQRLLDWYARATLEERDVALRILEQVRTTGARGLVPSVLRAVLDRKDDHRVIRRVADQLGCAPPQSAIQFRVINRIEAAVARWPEASDAERSDLTSMVMEAVGDLPFSVFDLVPEPDETPRSRCLDVIRCCINTSGGAGKRKEKTKWQAINEFLALYNIASDSPEALRRLYQATKQNGGKPGITPL